MDRKNEGSFKWFIALHGIFMLYSLGGVFSKLAAGTVFLSLNFCVLYGVVLLLLFIYAMIWQQLLKHIPLTTAFANKAVTTIWGLIWGKLFFHETITIGKMVGAAIVIVGIVLYARSDCEDNNG